VDLLDVYATVLDLAGIESDHRRGVSFRPLLSSDPIATEPRTNALLEYHGISKRRALALEEDGYDIAPVDRERHGIATADCYYFEGPFGTELLGDCDPAVLESDLEGLIADLETRDDGRRRGGSLRARITTRGSGVSVTVVSVQP